MSDWASNPCLGPRRHNLRSGACMGVFSQLFHWNRVLGGKKNLTTTFLEPDAQMSPSRKEAEIRRRALVKPVLRSTQKTNTTSPEGLGHGEQDWEASTEAAMTQLGGLSVMVSDSSSREIAMELRQVLHAKQEPFVLKDVIREKRQPVRIKSSREVKLVGANQTGQTTRRSQISKKSKSSESRKVRANGSGKPPASKSVTHESITGSAAVVQTSNRAPAESMVAMPSYQAVYGQSVKKALLCPTTGTWKVASPGRNPVKSPNKRALLMEAAAKILEGSNRSRKPLTSVRSLLAELEGKNAEEKPRAFSLQKEPSGKQEVSSQNMVRPGERVVEGKKHFSKQKAHATSRSKQIRSSSEDRPGMSQRLDKDLLTMQSRVFPYDRSLNGSEALTTLATPVHSPAVQEVFVQRTGGCILHQPGMEKREDGTTDAVKGTEGCSLRSFLRQQAIQRERAAVVLPKLITEDSPRLEQYEASINESEALAPTSRASKKDFSFSSLTSTDGLPEHGLFNCNDEIPANKSLGGSPAEYLQDYDVPMVKFATASHIAGGTDPARRKTRCEDSEEELRLHAGESSESFTGADDVVVQTCCLVLDAGDVKMEQSSTNRSDLCKMSAEMDGKELLTARKKPSMLRLCDYSWWEREDYQIITAAEEEGDQQPYQDPPHDSHQFSKDCDEYASLTTVRSPFALKVFKEGKDASNLEGELSISPDHTCIDEFQQSSPVSVLDAVFEGDFPTLGTSFVCFEEARQQLLENVQRYEMLAQMDLDMLMKLTEEQYCSELEEESDGSNLEKLRETGATDMSVNSSGEQAPSTFVDFPEFHSWNEGGFSGVGEQGSECDNESYAHLFEESQYGVSLHSHAERHMCYLQELGVKVFSPASDCTFDLIEWLKEGERLSCKLLFDCFGEALEPHPLGVANHVVEANPWTYAPFRDMLKKLGKPAFSSALGVVNALVQTDLKCAGTGNWRDFSQEVEDMVIELESTLFGVLMHELLSDLVQES